SKGNLWLPGDLHAYLWPSQRLMADIRTGQGIAHVEEIRDTEEWAGGPNTFFEDREHNVWFGTSKGLDRFSYSKVARVMPECTGLGYALVAGDAGTVWAACGHGELRTGSLLKIQNGQIVAQREIGDFTAAYRDPSGTVWFGGPTELAHLQGDTL